MKTTHIILIILLIAGIGIIASLLYNADTYSDFEAARAKPGSEHQIIGTLVAGKPNTFDTLRGPRFTFYMKDDEGHESKVAYQGTKPQDFEKLEQVVVIGHWADSLFLATSLLLKCPSKYNDDKKPEEFGEKKF